MATPEEPESDWIKMTMVAFAGLVVGIIIGYVITAWLPGASVG